MKRLSLLLAILFIGTAIYLVSCSKEKTYSYDEGLNDYAAMTMTVHQGISREHLAKMGIDTQFAIFNSLSSVNKARIMKEKIQILLDMETVSSDDKIHLQNLSDYLTGDVYESVNNGNDAFLDNWKTYAIDNLQWDETKMGIYLYTWLTKDEILGGSANGGNKFIRSLDPNNNGGDGGQQTSL